MRITKVTTKTGDKGKTALADGTRVNKDSLRVHCLGSIDELNTSIGFAAVLLPIKPEIDLKSIQNDLLNIGAEISIPNSEKSGGVSRRISGDERSDIKNIINNLNIPEGMSVIVRTAGLGRAIEELKWDVDYLMNLWNQIQETAPNAVSPSLIYKDDKLILRVFRDYFRDNIG